jgi:hypothetical protein
MRIVLCLFCCLSCTACFLPRGTDFVTVTGAESQHLDRLKMDGRIVLLQTRRLDDGTLEIVTSQGGIQVVYRLLPASDGKMQLQRQQAWL